MPDAEKTARIFKALAAGTRVRILELLKGRSLCVNALAHRLGITPAAVSQHLRILRDAGIVVPEKKGYFVHYRLDQKTATKWSEAANRLLNVKG